LDLLLSGCWVEGRETGYERPAELFNVFMTYSFDLHKEVTAGNIIINNQSRTMSFNKTGAGTAAAAPASAPVKEAVADKKSKAPRKDKTQDSMTITSFFTRKPPGVVPAAASAAAASATSPTASGADEWWWWTRTARASLITT
jgi:hypothetical protein